MEAGNAPGTDTPEDPGSRQTYLAAYKKEQKAGNHHPAPQGYKLQAFQDKLRRKIPFQDGTLHHIRPGRAGIEGSQGFRLRLDIVIDQGIVPEGV
jgi:hypothetical protein